MDVREIETAPGLVFDVSVGGPEDGPLVLLLHGFGVSRHFWSAQVPALAKAGFRAVAPNQRGYAKGARPDTTDPSERRFHLVGHDWGGSLAWAIADRHPERLASLTILSRPHPTAFAEALALPDGEQKRRSGHHTAFLDPGAGPRLLSNDCEWLRTRLGKSGVPADKLAAHLSVLGNPEAMEAALAWYRARGERQSIKPTEVPTLYLWGDADDTVGRAAAEGTVRFIAAPYRFEILPGVGHYAADQVPDKVNVLLLEHLARHPI
jgi:pimeloyl-ACP methyl ester carboxylesterase